MNELHKVIEETQAGCASLEAEPTLEGLLLDAALHLLERIAKVAKTREEVASEVESKRCEAGIVQQDRCVEIVQIVALEDFCPIVPYIIIIWADDKGIEGKEVVKG